MEQIRSYCVGIPPCQVTLTVQETGGKGLCLFLTGGDTPHVGGVVLAVPSVNVHGTALTCDLSQLCAPRHKDVILAAKAARRVCQATGQITSATAGIHVDHATGEDIRSMLKNGMKAVELFLTEMGSNSETAETVAGDRCAAAQEGNLENGTIS